MKNRGFTLIEILVVLVIIVILVSMATINTNQDPRKDLLNTQAEKLKFSLEAISDEAIFNNKQIGLFFTQTELNPMLIEVNSTPGNSDLKYSWKPYQSRFAKIIKLEDEIQFELTSESTPIQLPFAKPTEDKISPQVQFQASGEQTIFSLLLKIPDYSYHVEIYGNGIGRFLTKQHNYE